MCRWVSEGKPVDGTKLTASSDNVLNLGHPSGNSATVDVIDWQWPKRQY